MKTLEHLKFDHAGNSTSIALSFIPFSQIVMIYVSTWLGYRVLKYFVKHYSECVLGVLLSEINVWTNKKQISHNL
jgi:putative Mn2+ efflux pump MntP